MPDTKRDPMPARRRVRTQEGGRAPIDRGLLPELIGYNLRKAQVAVFQDFQDAVAPCEITPGQFGVLVLIRANAGLSQTELGEAIGTDRSTMVTVMDRLERHGWVVRAPSPNDRRSYALKLSPEGERLVDELTARIREHERRMAADLSAAERRQLIDLLNRLYRPG
jgi:DNA-binding MarR family transcriptional regulator